VTILPADQNLAQFHSQDFAAKTMPERLVHELANTPDLITINHLRPAIVRKTTWPEQKRSVVLMGIHGVVPLLHQDPKKPLAEPVEPGKINVGHSLADDLDLSVGGNTVFMGRSFEIAKIYDQRGNTDDITLWIDLGDAQQMLGLEGQINMIQALGCNCASIDRLGDIEAEIAKVLGTKVQIIEQSTNAIARAKARNTVQAEGEAALRQWETLSSVLIPTVTVLAGLWVGMLCLSNVRQRQAEIGLWRAVGWPANRILVLLLSKATLIGLVGAALGYGIGFGGALVFGAATASEAVPVDASLFNPASLVVALLLAPFLAALASWLPALAAAGQDPAAILQKE
ncbi:MAG: ABC transporter permease, partial [Planctomycetota bacterium]|jgi:ABC-type lipoprotein release transport system permease subunit